MLQLYRQLAALLASYPDLMEDFVGFLLPNQALECGCFMENLDFNQARTFMLKLEVSSGQYSA